MKRAEVGLNGDVMPRLQSVMSLDSLLTNNLASGPFSAKASPLQLVVGLKRRSTCCYSRPILLLINTTRLHLSFDVGLMMFLVSPT